MFIVTDIAQFETIKAIPGFKSYYASSQGNVYRNKKNIFVSLAKSKTKKGYLTSRLFNKRVFVHRSVLAAFSGKFLELQVNHIDSDKQNNCVSNLEWVTNRENFDYRVKNGGAGLYKKGQFRGEKHPRAKLTDKDALDIKNSKDRLKTLAVKYKVSIHTIHAIRSKRNWAFV